MTNSVSHHFSDLYLRLPVELHEEEETESSKDGIMTSEWWFRGNTLSMSFGPTNEMTLSFKVNDEEQIRETHIGDENAIGAFLEAARSYLEILNDPWNDDTDYGYADWTTIGTETWEDQAGMESLKRDLAISDAWFLIKVTNFGRAGRSLGEMEKWLKQNCQMPYKRVGWSSGCSTKVGVAFECGNDAFFFKLRWK